MLLFHIYKDNGANRENLILDATRNTLPQEDAIFNFENTNTREFVSHVLDGYETSATTVEERCESLLTQYGPNGPYNHLDFELKQRSYAVRETEGANPNAGTSQSVNRSPFEAFIKRRLPNW